MSTLLKKPFIEEVVDGLDDASISSFQRFLDMGDGYSTSYQLRDGKLPHGANPSVERCTLLIDGPAQLCGVYAKYKKGNENRSAMVSFTTLETCTMYEIDESRLTCRRIRERLSASELRRVLRERDIAKTENGSVIYNDGIEVKRNGDVVIGKNLEVEGTTKLNSGIEPIHRYELDSKNFLNVLFEKTNGYSMYAGFGYFDLNDNLSPCIFRYVLSSGKVFRLWGINERAIYTYDGQKLTMGAIAQEKNVQSKLYRHVITLSSSSDADNTCRLEWLSPNNLVCDSLQDLRIILGNPQMNSYVASNPSGDLFGVVVSASLAQFKKVGATELINITIVSDNVTTL